MAKYKLKNYTMSRVVIGTNPSIEAVEITLEMENQNGNVDKRKYTLHTDTNYPSLESIERVIGNGLKEAIEKAVKIGVSDYPERAYVTITIPAQRPDARQKMEDHRLTAHRI